MSNSLNLALPYVQAAQAQKHVTVNEALRRLDSVVQLGVLSRTLIQPPASPQEGDRYIVGGGATGAWLGRDRQVAAYIDGAWAFFVPRAGWFAFVQAEGAVVHHDGTAWRLTATGAGPQTVATFGINGGADTTNRLVVHSEAVLFAADTTVAVPTGDVRIKASKVGGADVASHLFQTNYSGRAEFGLIGSDDFSLKVSPDGSTWVDGFSVERATGRVSFARPPAVAGLGSITTSLPSRAAVMGVTVPAGVLQIEVRGYAVENDGGGGTYRRVAAAPNHGLSVQDAAGTWFELLTTGGTIRARQAGAVGDNVVDDTLALQRAFASGFNVVLEAATFRVSGPLTTGRGAQRIMGAGRQLTRLRVDTAFPLDALGVLVIAHSDASISDLSIQFNQGAAATRAALVAYPPAIHMNNRPRVRLKRMRFTAAYNGIRALENCGGAIFDDIECGSFNVGFEFAGSLDSVELRNCRVWPYDFAGSAALYGVYSDSQTVAFRMGRVDDLKMIACTGFRARFQFVPTNGVGPFGALIGCALDGRYSRIEMAAGELQASSLYATSDAADDFFIEATGGQLTLSSFDFDCAAHTRPMVHVNGGALKASDGVVQTGPHATTQVFRVSHGHLGVEHTHIFGGGSVARTVPVIEQVGGVLIANGNSMDAAGTGTGEFIRVGTNGPHIVTNNSSGGRPITLPAVRTLGLYGPNLTGSAVAFATPLRLVAVDEVSAGGEIVLDGAGAHADVTLDNRSGDLRLSSFAAGRGVVLSGTEGSSSLTCARLRLQGGVALSAGAGTGTGSTAVGANVLGYATTGANNTALGIGAGSAVVTGSSNTAVGANALSSAEVPAAVTNATALGSGASVTGSNQVQLGNSATTTYAFGAVQVRSDARDKADVRDTVLGLEFIKALRPVDFRWNYREDYAAPDEPAPAPGSRRRERFHHGFLAQEVGALIERTGVDFGGYQDHRMAGGADVRSLGLTELLAPVVRAIQEVSARLDALERG